MKSMLRTAGCGLTLALVLTLSGCGGGAPATPMGTVTGKVTLGDQPLADVTVSFFEEKTAMAASGDTGADGTYKLLYAGGPQIPVGNYKVRVTSKEEPMKPGAAAGTLPPASKPFPGPKMYEAFDTSTLTAEVKVGENKVDLPLKKE